MRRIGRAIVAAAPCIRAAHPIYDDEYMRKEEAYRQEVVQSLKSTPPPVSQRNYASSMPIVAPLGGPRVARLMAAQSTSGTSSLTDVLVFASALMSLLMGIKLISSRRDPIRAAQTVSFGSTSPRQRAQYVLYLAITTYAQREEDRRAFLAARQREPTLSFEVFLDRRSPGWYAGTTTAPADVLAELVRHLREDTYQNRLAVLVRSGYYIRDTPQRSVDALLRYAGIDSSTSTAPRVAPNSNGAWGGSTAWPSQPPPPTPTSPTPEEGQAAPQHHSGAFQVTMADLQQDMDATDLAAAGTDPLQRRDDGDRRHS